MGSFIWGSITNCWDSITNFFTSGSCSQPQEGLNTNEIVIDQQEQEQYEEQEQNYVDPNNDNENVELENQLNFDENQQNNQHQEQYYAEQYNVQIGDGEQNADDNQKNI